MATSEPWGNILIYGGAAAGQPVAELFDPMKEEWLPLDLSAAGGAGGPGGRGAARSSRDAPAGSRRAQPAGRHRGARPDPGRRRRATGSARGDSLLYYPAQRRFGPGPLTLRHPRTGFVAFVINDDLVVVGRLRSRPGSKLVDTAEIYDIKTWQLVRPSRRRCRAPGPPRQSLPNLSVVVLGGETAGSSSNAVEIYQPRR